MGRRRALAPHDAVSAAVHLGRPHHFDWRAPLAQHRAYGHLLHRTFGARRRIGFPFFHPGYEQYDRQRQPSSALRFRLRRGCGATGDHMPMQPATAAGFNALDRLGECGNSEAVWPSSPIPKTTASKGRGTRANVSHADTAPKSGVGAPFFRPTKCSSGGLLQQHIPHELFVAAGVGWVDPTLVGERDADPAPINISDAQKFEQERRRLPARHHEAGQGRAPRWPAACRRAASRRKRARQGFAVGELAGRGIGRVCHLRSVAFAHTF